MVATACQINFALKEIIIEEHQSKFNRALVVRVYLEQESISLLHICCIMASLAQNGNTELHQICFNGQLHLLDAVTRAGGNMYAKNKVM